MFPLDPMTRPRPWWTKRWIDMTRLLKRFSPTGAFDFSTYLELLWWIVFCVTINPFRWNWALFVFLGIGREGPVGVVEVEDRVREKLGLTNGVEGEDEGLSI